MIFIRTIFNLMIVGNNYTYIHLPKCGGNSIIKTIEKYYNGKRGIVHSRLTEKPNNKKIIGSIRNPLSWYVSLWAFGCGGEGFVREIIEKNESFHHEII